MFSGLTNQVSSWIGAAKGDPHDEEVPAPPPTTSDNQDGELSQQHLHQQQQQQPTETPVAITSINEDEEKKLSPTKAGGMFSNVKSQMSGWLGSASIPSMPAMPSMPNMPAMPSIPSIPGLRKSNNAGENAAEGGIANEGLATSPDKHSPSTAHDIGGGAGGSGVDDDDKSRYISATEGADSRPLSASGTPTDEQAGQIGNVTTKVTQGAKTFGSFLYSAVNKAGAKIKKTVEENTILSDFNKQQEQFIKEQDGNTGAGVAPWAGHKYEEKVKEEILNLSADRRNFVRAPPAGFDYQFDYTEAYPTAQVIMAEDPALEKMRFELVPKIITEENFWRNYFYRVSLICQAGELGTLGGDSLAPQSSNDDNEGEEQWEKDLEAELQDYEVVNDGKNNDKNLDSNWDADAEDLLNETDDLK